MDITLDFKDIKDKDSLHGYLKQQLGLPEYYGNNLDALHDCLTEISEPISIKICNFNLLKECLGDYADMLIQVLLIGANIHIRTSIKYPIASLLNNASPLQR